MLRLGVIAWNAALLSSNTLKETLPGMVEAFPVSEHQKILVLLEQMIQRKKLLFANDRRYIIEYHLRMENDGPFLSVVSSDA